MLFYGIVLSVTLQQSLSYTSPQIVLVEAVCISSTEFIGDDRIAQFQINDSSDKSIPKLLGSKFTIKYQEVPNSGEGWSGSRRISDLVLDRFSPKDKIYWWVRVTDVGKPTQRVEPMLNREHWFKLLKNPDLLLRPIRTVPRVKQDHVAKYSDEVQSLGQAVMKVASLSKERAKQREVLLELQRDKCPAVAEWATWMIAQYFSPRVANNGREPEMRQPISPESLQVKP